MHKFKCAYCSNTVYFENTRCLQCGHRLAFDAERMELVTLSPDAGREGLYQRIDARGPGRRSRPHKDHARVRLCANTAYRVCNWLTPAEASSSFCRACALNRIIPNLSEPGSLRAWAELERAKKRLIYSLLRFGLPFDRDVPADKGPMTFDFVRDALTGHLDGLITIDIMEADAVERERQRQQFQELYRSLLGHLRHETGHYFWMVLIDAAGHHDAFRALFGDERQPYGDAIARHYADGPPADWQGSFVSAYASSHPWEDWAETWAHYLHMADALDTAGAEGMEPRRGRVPLLDQWRSKRTFDCYRDGDFQALFARWVPLTLSLNSLSRSMGHNDFYPFVIPVPVYRKLSFMHELIRQSFRDAQSRKTRSRWRRPRQ